MNRISQGKTNAHPNTCPKADRCIHAAECVNFDAFRGEYLCFDSGAYSDYDKKGRRNQAEAQKEKEEEMVSAD